MTKMKRVVLIVLDGVGCGAQADADKYGDVGANTLKHVYEQGKPEIPNLRELGLLCAAGIVPAEEEEPVGCYGRMTERAAGKDTTTGHWEIAGLTLDKPFPTYPNGFPEELIKQFEEAVGLETIGNKPASGTAIIEELGAEHLRTCKLIVYTSADSVFQIAAHEAIVPPAELWHYCRIARRLLKGEHAVGRVIARPFVGEIGAFLCVRERLQTLIQFADGSLRLGKRLCQTLVFSSNAVLLCADFYILLTESMQLVRRHGCLFFRLSQTVAQCKYVFIDIVAIIALH